MAEGEWYRPFWGTDLTAELAKISQELSLPEYDLLLIGDGSGTINSKASGWACVCFNKHTDEISVHNGAMSCGTNNFAELMPYLQALWVFDQYWSKKGPIGTVAHIEIISDSELTVKGGNKEYGRNSNQSLWAALTWFETCGRYTIHWNHVYRNTNLFSHRCDWLAGHTKTVLEKLRRQLLCS